MMASLGVEELSAEVGAATRTDWCAKAVLEADFQGLTLKDFWVYL